MRVIILENADIQVLSMVLSSKYELNTQSEVPALAEVSSKYIPVVPSEDDPMKGTEAPFMDIMEKMGISIEDNSSTKGPKAQGLLDIIKEVVAEKLGVYGRLNTFLVLNFVWERIQEIGLCYSINSLIVKIPEALQKYKRFGGPIPLVSIRGANFWYGKPGSKAIDRDSMPTFFGKELCQEYAKNNPKYNQSEFTRLKMMNDLVGEMAKSFLYKEGVSNWDIEIYVKRMVNHFCRGYY